MREFDRDRSTSKPKGSNYVAAPKITSCFWCGLQPLHAEFLLKERFWINEPQKWHSLTAEQAENSDKKRKLTTLIFIRKTIALTVIYDQYQKAKIVLMYVFCCSEAITRPCLARNMWVRKTSQK